MQAISPALRTGQPATTVIRLTVADRAQNTGVSLVESEPRPIAAILPQVLARYGLGEIAQSQESQPRQLDLFA